MDAFIDFLINWGYWGMLISAFLAGSILPFSSEAVMVGLLAAGLQPGPLVVYGTIGNVAGSIMNYGIGRLGKPEDIAYAATYLCSDEATWVTGAHFVIDGGACMMG